MLLLNNRKKRVSGRYYQVDSLTKVKEEWDEGNKRVLLVAPTGSGKTVTAGLIIDDEVNNNDGRVLVVTDRKKLTRQFAQRTEQDFGIECGIEMASEGHGGERVVCATVQTITNRIQQGKFHPEDFSMLCFDEAHLCIQKGEPVLMADGTWKPIELVVASDSVVCYNEELCQTTTSKVLAHWNRGRKRTIRIHLENGMTFAGTEDHPVLTQNGWVNIGALKITDHVLCAPVDVGIKLPSFYQLEDSPNMLLGHVVSGPPINGLLSSKPSCLKRRYANADVVNELLSHAQSSMSGCDVSSPENIPDSRRGISTEGISGERALQTTCAEPSLGPCLETLPSDMPMTGQPPQGSLEDTAQSKNNGLASSIQRWDLGGPSKSRQTKVTEPYQSDTQPAALRASEQSTIYSSQKEKRSSLQTPSECSDHKDLHGGLLTMVLEEEAASPSTPRDLMMSQQKRPSTSSLNLANADSPSQGDIGSSGSLLRELSDSSITSSPSLMSGFPKMSATSSPVVFIEGIGEREVFDLTVEDHHNFVVGGAIVHNCLGAGFQSVANHFNDSRLVGLTATPRRGDRKDLMKFFNSMVEPVTLPQLIEQGFLAPLTIQNIPISIKLETKHKTGDYDDEEISHCIEPYLDACADALIQNGSDRCSLVFLPLIKTSKRFTELLQSKGLRAEHVDGEMGEQAVNAAIRRLELGKIQALCCSQILAIGVDIRPVNLILNLRPTRSWTFFVQVCGRGTRTFIRDKDDPQSAWPDKTDCLLLDPQWLTEEHSLLQRPSVLVAKDEEEAQCIDAALKKGGGGSLMEAVKGAAHEREEKLRQKLEAMSKRKARLVNAMDFMLAMHLPDFAEYEPLNALEARPIKSSLSEKQMAWLVKSKFDLDSIKNFGHAKHILNALGERAKAGMSTMGQVTYAASLGLDKEVAFNMPFKEISEWIDKHAPPKPAWMANWKKKY